MRVHVPVTAGCLVAALSVLVSSVVAVLVVTALCTVHCWPLSRHIVVLTAAAAAAARS